jgi:carbon storage regulator
MLILSRKIGESLIIDGNIEVKVLNIKNGNVRIGVRAPHDITVDRQEVHERKQDPNPNYETKEQNL